MTNKKISKNQQKKIERANQLLDRQIAAFDSYFAEQYGPERYKKLKAALLERGMHVALVNKRADREVALKVLDADGGSRSSSTVEYLPTFFENVYIRVAHMDSNGSLKPSTPEEPKTLPPSHNDCLIAAGEDSATTSTMNDVDDELHSMMADNELLWPSPSTSRDSNNLSVYYPLDAASLIPVHLLEVQPQNRVLDLCAAPGVSCFVREEGDEVYIVSHVLFYSIRLQGKSLAICQRLYLCSSESNGDNGLLGHLDCNDVSNDRRIRLIAVLKQYLPPECLDQTSVTLGDATSRTFGLKRGALYDRILVDAPCSSERHLLAELAAAQARTVSATQIQQQAKEFMSWSPNRCKSNADRQFLLLWNALQMLRVGGKLVYSTCALSSLENDGVIEKLQSKLDKHNEKSVEEDRFRVRILDVSGVPFGEPTKFGWQILPDTCGWGPIYTAVMQKEEY